MGRDYLPRGDGELLQWTRNFSRLLNESPERYDVPPERAAALAGLYETFASSYAAAQDPSTRTRAAVVRKNDDRTQLKRQARSLARWVSANQNVTDIDRADLGLTIRTKGSPIPRPAAAPTIEVVSADGWQVVLQLRHAGSGRRGKGPHIMGAVLWYATGEQPPTDANLWKHVKTTSRTRCAVSLPPTLPAGTRVWLCSRWMNPRGQTSPASAATGILLGGGVPRLATSKPTIRLAA